MNREDALVYVKKNGPLPEPPPLEARTCPHAASSLPCSCHLTVEQHGVAEGLGDYTLYLFGLPYRGRVKVPYAPPAVMPPTPTAQRQVRTPRPGEAFFQRRAGSPLAIRQHVAPVASPAANTHVAPAATASLSAARPPKRAFDPVYNSAYAKARRRGPEAVAAFKAEWAARKAAA